MTDDSNTSPPFKAEETLAMLGRHLRDLRLLERAGRYEWKGDPLVELRLDGATIRVRTVKQPARSPQWSTLTLANAADVRKFTEDFKRQFAQWKQRDE